MPDELKKLRELSEKARACTNGDYKAALVEAHIGVSTALERLQKEPTAEHLRDVVCMWSFAARVYKGAPPEADPQPPLAGAPTAALLSIAA